MSLALLLGLVIASAAVSSTVEGPPLSVEFRRARESDSAYRQLSRLGDVGKFEAWLGRIARNCVTDHLRDRLATLRLIRWMPRITT